VLVALFADIHANKQAFSACLRQARELGAEQIVLLGDYVGYGADPEWTVATVRELVDQGAFAVRGNHDNAISELSESLNVEARVAIEWSRNQLGAEERKFLQQLPLTFLQDDRLYVHSEASNPIAWNYVTDGKDAARSMRATFARITFCGHIHRPAIYTMSANGKMAHFVPTTDSPVPILPNRRWLAVLGSVGQPRDGNPASSFALLDTDQHELTYHRAPYDVEQAAARIRSNGLPTWLADRLPLGK
jgi:diadenosine tetraphosphatase ApaH/serine/threonine PP2A family protein phosphatase